jgi:hypothetical protein
MPRRGREHQVPARGAPLRGQARQRLVGLGVPGRRRVQHRDPAVGDLHAPARGQPHQFGAHQADAGHVRRGQPATALPHRQQHEVIAERAHRVIRAGSHAATLTSEPREERARAGRDAE